MSKIIRSILNGLRSFGPLRLEVEPNSITVATSVVGLGNRLIAFASARGLAAEFSVPKVNLIWIADRQVADCKFTDLFELTASDTGIALDRKIGYSLLVFYLGIYGRSLVEHSKLRGVLSMVLRWMGYRLIRKSFDRIYHLLDMSAETWEHSWQTAARFRRRTPELGNRTLLYSHELFHRAPRFDFCQPRQYLQKRVDEVVNGFAQHTVGVHIRSLDFIGARIKKQSPLELFIRKMADEVKRDDNVKFFLATDSDEVRVDLMKCFPGRVITQESSLMRTMKAGMENAVVDMFTLARTDKILIPYRSTFSRCAAMIGETEVEVVLNDSVLNQVYKQDLAPAMRAFEDEQSC